MDPRPYVGVIGGRDCTPEEARLARELGQGIAREGWVLVCGGGAGSWNRPAGARARRAA